MEILIISLFTSLIHIIVLLALGLANCGPKKNLKPAMYALATNIFFKQKKY